MGFCRKDFINGIVLFFPTLIMKGDLVRFVLVRERGRAEPIGRECQSQMMGGSEKGADEEPDFESGVNGGN